MKKILEAIAFKYGVGSLETRNNDLLDFYDMVVWNFKDALEEATKQE